MLQAGYAARLAMLADPYVMVPRRQAFVSWDRSGTQARWLSTHMLRELHVCLRALCSTILVRRTGGLGAILMPLASTDLTSGWAVRR